MADYDGSIRIGVKVDDEKAKKDIGSLRNSLETSLDGSVKLTDKFKSALSTAGKVGAVAIGAASSAVGALAKQSLDAYASFEQLTGGVETLFKDSANAVMQYANDAYKTAGMSANQYMETATGFAASLIQSLGGNTAKAADVADMAIRDMSDNANKMGTSMESIRYAYQGFAKQNFTMLDNLKLGYGGTKEEMERLLADAEKLSGVKYDISSFSDIANAIHVVQTEMGIAGTTAAEAAGTIEGSALSAKAAWENLLTGLADENADLTTLTENFVNSAKTALANMMPRLEQILSSMGELITGLAPVIGEEIPKLISQVLPSLIEAGIKLIGGIVSGISTALPQLLDAAVDIMVMLGEAIKEYIPSAISAIPDIILGIVDFLAEHLPELIQMGADILKALADGILQAIPALLEKLPEIINSLVSFIAENIPMIAEAGLEIIIGIVTGMIEAIPKIVEAIPEIISGLLNAISGNLPKLMEAGFALLIKLGDGIIEAVPELLAAIPAVIESLIEAFGALITGAFDIGKSIVNGIWEGISSMLQWIVKKVKGFIDAIIETAKDALGGLFDGKSSSGYSGNVGGGNTYAARAFSTYDLSGIDSLPDIPRLAKGAVISPNSEFLAILGDQRSGTNIEAPMSTMEEAFLSALSKSGLLSQEKSSGTGVAELSIDGRTFARLIFPYTQGETVRRGVNLVSGGA